MADTEDKLQHSVYNLENIAHDFSVELPTVKSNNVLALQGGETIHSKICLYYKITEKIILLNI
jgi:hypothetical protein